MEAILVGVMFRMSDYNRSNNMVFCIRVVIMKVSMWYFM